MIAALRWLAMPPAALLAWWGSLLIGFELLEVAIRFCPPEDLVSGTCVAPWYRDLEDAIIAGCAGLAAALIVGVSALLAPSQRLLVATVVLAAGVLVALHMAVGAQAWGSLAAALVAGLLAWGVVFQWARKAVRSNSAAEDDAAVPAPRASARAPHRGR